MHLRDEIWKNVEGYEGYYKVSNMGRVKSLRKGLILKSFMSSQKRYLAVSLCVKGLKKKLIPIGRLVALTFIGPKKGCPDIHYKNGNRYDNRLDNLEWVEKNTGAREKISIPLSMNLIKALINNKPIFTVKELSKKYKLTQSLVEDILYRRRRFKDLNKEGEFNGNKKRIRIEQ